MSMKNITWKWNKVRKMPRNCVTDITTSMLLRWHQHVCQCEKHIRQQILDLCFRLWLRVLVPRFIKHLCSEQCPNKFLLFFHAFPHNLENANKFDSIMEEANEYGAIIDEWDKYDTITEVLDQLLGVYSWSEVSMLLKIYLLFLVKYYQSLCLGSTKLVVETSMCQLCR